LVKKNLEQIPHMVFQYTVTSLNNSADLVGFHIPLDISETKVWIITKPYANQS